MNGIIHIFNSEQMTIDPVFNFPADQLYRSMLFLLLTSWIMILSPQLGDD